MVMVLDANKQLLKVRPTYPGAGEASGKLQEKLHRVRVHLPCLGFDLNFIVGHTHPEAGKLFFCCLLCSTSQPACTWIVMLLLSLLPSLTVLMQTDGALIWHGPCLSVD